jgi:hypothetical protein
MTARERLPNRRRCVTVNLDHAGHRFTLTTGYYRDGRIAEVFISSSKPSGVEAVARDGAIVTSIALQFGASLETIRVALTKDYDGTPATLLGAALDALGEGMR